MLSTFINIPFVIKIFILSTFEWPFYTGLNVFLTLKAPAKMYLKMSSVEVVQCKYFLTLLTYVKKEENS